MQHSNYATYYYYNTASRKTTWREMSLLPLSLYKILQPRQIVPVCTLFNLSLIHI